ncbi:hypothetical protein Taro_005483 [Colocasia esculenta]|uniref:Uncharacterized protein n=1 Tax=Colocasia esculenta TaxID=4460 RepID=A0A843TUI5_COLES|nr:hypothetical protein [Colocasia esculenta]
MGSPARAGLRAGDPPTQPDHGRRCHRLAPSLPRPLPPLVLLCPASPAIREIRCRHNSGFLPHHATPSSDHHWWRHSHPLLLLLVHPLTASHSHSLGDSPPLFSPSLFLHEPLPPSLTPTVILFHHIVEPPTTLQAQLAVCHRLTVKHATLQTRPLPGLLTPRCSAQQEPVALGPKLASQRSPWPHGMQNRMNRPILARSGSAMADSSRSWTDQDRDWQGRIPDPDLIRNSMAQPISVLQWTSTRPIPVPHHISYYKFIYTEEKGNNQAKYTNVNKEILNP